MPLIPPTVGRKVHYWPCNDMSKTPTLKGVLDRDMFQAQQSYAAAQARTTNPPANIELQPLDASIAAVNRNGTVNLSIASPTGAMNYKCDVPLRQPDDEKPAGSYCEWMPFQVAAHVRQEPVDDGKAKAKAR